MVADQQPLPLFDKIIGEIKLELCLTLLNYFKVTKNQNGRSMQRETSFICWYGTFQYEVMLFGLMNSHDTFQGISDRTLQNVENFRCYVDDIVISSQNEQDQIIHLANVFHPLQNHGRRIRINQCFLMQQKGDLLRHIVDKGGVHVDGKKIDKVKENSAPTKRKELPKIHTWIRKVNEDYLCKDIGES